MKRVKKKKIRDPKVPELFIFSNVRPRLRPRSFEGETANDRIRRAYAVISFYLP